MADGLSEAQLRSGDLHGKVVQALARLEQSATVGQQAQAALRAVDGHIQSISDDLPPSPLQSHATLHWLRVDLKRSAEL